LLQVVLIADVAIPIFAVPDGRAGPFAGAEAMIADFVAGELLPRGYDLGYGPSIHWLEKDMDMIGHHYPGQEPITEGIEA
jgi:hypothetical protein